MIHSSSPLIVVSKTSIPFKTSEVKLISASLLRVGQFAKQVSVSPLQIPLRKS